MSILNSVARPQGWQTAPFGRVAARVKEIGRPDLPPLSVFLGAGVVPRDSRDDNHNQLGEDVGKYLVVRPGDVVFNKLRTWQGGLGASAYEGIVSPAYFVCRPTCEYDSRFLQFLLLSEIYLQELTRVSKWQPPSQFDIGWEQLRMVPITAPDLSSQRAIADFLDSETARIDALIDKKQRLIAALDERLATAIAVEMSAAPVRRRLRHLATLGTGHTPDRNKREYWENCVIPWVTAADLSGRETPFEPLFDTLQKVSELGVANSAAVVHPAGTVMLCRTASVGLLCEIGAPMATTQAFVTWTPGPELDSTFLLFALASMSQEWKKLAFGSTHETIYMPDLESVRIPFFPLVEQQMVVDRLLTKVDSAMALHRSLARQIELLREHRQALITAAVTGQIEIPGVAA